MKEALLAIRDLLQAAAVADTPDEPWDLSIDLPMPEDHPIRWLRTRLGLTATEERVLAADRARAVSCVAARDTRSDDRAGGRAQGDSA